MGRPKPRYASKGPRRHSDWSLGANEETFPLTGSVTNVTLWTPVSNKEAGTIIRIVGEVHVRGDVNDWGTLASGGGKLDQTVHMGVQVVNRALGAAGTARDPSGDDDYEGKEWMWRKTVNLAYTITDGTMEPPDWYIPLSEAVLGGTNDHVDIKVKRKLDLSQDELVFSSRLVNRVATGALSAQRPAIGLHLRLLMLHT